MLEYPQRFPGLVGGTSKMIVGAILMKQQTPLPVVALLDNDVMGRDAAERLVDWFDFSKKQEILSYTEVLDGWPIDVEAKDLWPDPLLQRLSMSRARRPCWRRKSTVKS